MQQEFKKKFPHATDEQLPRNPRVTFKPIGQEEYDPLHLAEDGRAKEEAAANAKGGLSAHFDLGDMNLLETPAHEELY